MPFSYANPTSGPSAGGIGWFVFDTFTTINPGDTITGLTGTLNNGTTVTFNLTAANVSGVTRSFDAVPVPTQPNAGFGNAGYTGITGNAALYAESLNAVGSNRLTLSNIVVLDNLGNPVPEYTAIVADAETTGAFESWTWDTSGGPWSLLAKLGPGTSPALSGLGTTTATLTGDNSSPENTAFVLTTQNPTQLQLTTANTTALANGREAVSIGFATTRVILQKDVSQRIDPSDQFVLNIAGTPADQATTTGFANGIQTETAQIYAIPGNTYQLSEAMALGSVSALADYTLTTSAANATPAGSIPPVGPLPISFTPALGDDVTYTFLNAAPETFLKTVDKAFADVGEILTYTVTVENPNDFSLNNVLVTDATPAGTTYIGNLNVSAPYTGTDPASGITITTIGPASSVTLSWQVQVSSVPPVSNPIPNYANVTVPGGTSGITNVVTTQVNTAFVSILKIVDKVYAKLGDILTYTLTLNNAGNVPADQVNITDSVPSGTTFVPGSVTGATGTPPNLTLTAPIPPSGTATVTFQVQVGDTIPNPNPIPNSAFATYTYTVDPENPDAASGSARSNLVNTLVNTAIVSIAKSVDRAYAALGDILTYTLTLENTGNTAADNVSIQDIIPNGTTFVPGSVTGATGTPPSLTLASPIPIGGSAVVTFQVQVGDTLPVPNPIPNTASAAFTYTVDPENPDGGTGTTTSNTVETQVNNAVVSILKAVDQSFANTGDVLTYTLTLTNTGNTPANQVVITDPVPSGTTFLNGSLTGATGTPPQFTLANPLLPGGNATVTFQVRIGDTIPSPNPIPNNASASYTFTIDPNVPDGASGSSDSNTVFTQVNTANVDSTKAVDLTYAQPGDILTYTLTLFNTGNVTANQVVITDAIPDGTSFVPGSLTGATGTPPVFTLITPIAAGGSRQVSFQVKVEGIPNVNPIPNTASFAYVYTSDPVNPGGETGGGVTNEVTTQVNVAILTVLKAVNKNIAYPGDIVTYQFAITNTGNTPAENVVLKDQLPNGLAYVPGSLTANVPVLGAPPSIQIGNPIAPGQIINVSFQARVTGVPVPNPAINRGTVDYDYPVDPEDPNVPGTADSNPVCTRIFRNDYSRQITDLTESVALEQAALAAIINAEGTKVQKMAAAENVTVQELLCLNRSVAEMVASIELLEGILRQKLSLIDCQLDHSCI